MHAGEIDRWLARKISFSEKQNNFKVISGKLVYLYHFEFWALAYNQLNCDLKTSMLPNIYVSIFGVEFWELQIVIPGE